jgi:unsaturated rhamnogalacturonyl hydrolase
MRDTVFTGLLYHAWDDSREAGWADKETGLSPEFWGRAIGWYAAAVMDILDYIPHEHKRRREFSHAAYEILSALVRFQDYETGLWFQVVNKGDHKDNWFETSCSCLYTYAIAKALKKGTLPKFYSTNLHKGYQGIIKSLKFEGENLIVPNICVGTGVGDLQFYFDRPTVENDLHGMGAFLLMCTAYYDTCRQLGL